MGYNTKYRITRVVMAGQCDENNGDAFAKVLCADPDFHVDAVTVAEFNRFEEMKWHEHEHDVAKAMAASGATRVELAGEGEENGDRWDKVFTRDDGDEHVTVELFRYALVRPNKPTSRTPVARR